jgi:hypothetical protein
MKYNSFTVRDDWDGQVITKIQKLSELRDTQLGSIVAFDSTVDGTKLISNEKKMSATSAAPFFYYVEEADRSAGVRVVVGTQTYPTNATGYTCSVKGLLNKDSNGNLCVDTTVTGGSCTMPSLGTAVKPLSMSNKALVRTIGDPAQDYGAENNGLLVAIYGKVSNKWVDIDTGSVWFDINDGSGPVPVADYFKDGLISPAPVNDQYWKATGVIAYAPDPRTVLPYTIKRTLIVDAKKGEKITPP